MKRFVVVCMALILALLMATSAAENAVEAGDSVFFGSYKQSSNPFAGAEPLEWIVLDTYPDAGVALVTTKYLIDAKPFSLSDETTWAQSDVRQWLNSEFLSKAFSETERTAILLTPVQTPDYDGYDGGEDTEDYVFLLSIGEATLYFNSTNALFAYPTKYAILQGVCMEANATNAFWWLRSADSDRYTMAVVSYGDRAYTNVAYPDSYYGVRPAMWVRINELTPVAEQNP